MGGMKAIESAPGEYQDSIQELRKRILHLGTLQQSLLSLVMSKQKKIKSLKGSMDPVIKLINLIKRADQEDERALYKLFIHEKNGIYQNISLDLERALDSCEGCDMCGEVDESRAESPAPHWRGRELEVVPAYETRRRVCVDCVHSVLEILAGSEAEHPLPQHNPCKIFELVTEIERKTEEVRRCHTEQVGSALNTKALKMWVNMRLAGAWSHWYDIFMFGQVIAHGVAKFKTLLKRGGWEHWVTQISKTRHENHIAQTYLKIIYMKKAAPMVVAWRIETAAAVQKQGAMQSLEQEIDDACRSIQHAKRLFEAEYSAQYMRETALECHNRIKQLRRDIRRVRKAGGAESLTAVWTALQVAEADLGYTIGQLGKETPEFRRSKDVAHQEVGSQEHRAAMQQLVKLPKNAKKRPELLNLKEELINTLEEQVLHSVEMLGEHMREDPEGGDLSYKENMKAAKQIESQEKGLSRDHQVMVVDLAEMETFKPEGSAPKGGDSGDRGEAGPRPGRRNEFDDSALPDFSSHSHDYTGMTDTSDIFPEGSEMQVTGQVYGEGEVEGEVVTTYACEECNTEYDTIEQAVACEEKHARVMATAGWSRVPENDIPGEASPAEKAGSFPYHLMLKDATTDPGAINEFHSAPGEASSSNQVPWLPGVDFEEASANAAPRCVLCKHKFSSSRWQHTCANCSRVVCNICSPLQPPRSRRCNHCYKEEADQEEATALKVHNSKLQTLHKKQVENEAQKVPAHEAYVDTCLSRLPLPPQWEKGITPEGEPFYIDHSSSSTHWEHPSLMAYRNGNGDQLDALPLPEGWEAGATPEGKTFYIDHATSSTHWEHPAAAALMQGAMIFDNDGDRGGGYIRIPGGLLQAPSSTRPSPLSAREPSYTSVDTRGTRDQTRGGGIPGIPRQAGTAGGDQAAAASEFEADSASSPSKISLLIPPDLFDVDSDETASTDRSSDEAGGTWKNGMSPEEREAMRVGKKLKLRFRQVSMGVEEICSQHEEFLLSRMEAIYATKLYNQDYLIALLDWINGTRIMNKVRRFLDKKHKEFAKSGLHYWYVTNRQIRKTVNLSKEAMIRIRNSGLKAAWLRWQDVVVDIMAGKELRRLKRERSLTVAKHQSILDDLMESLGTDVGSLKEQADSIQDVLARPTTRNKMGRSGFQECKAVMDEAWCQLNVLRLGLKRSSKEAAFAKRDSQKVEPALAGLNKLSAFVELARAQEAQILMMLWRAGISAMPKSGPTGSNRSLPSPLDFSSTSPPRRRQKKNTALFPVDSPGAVAAREIAGEREAARKKKQSAGKANAMPAGSLLGRRRAKTIGTMPKPTALKR